MKVVLVSTYAQPAALGLRYVSSYLKAAGHDVEMIFMSSRRATSRADFSRRALEAFIERCRGADLIGMSLMTNSFHRAGMLTQTLRRAANKAPIIWGGIHPTVAPDESLEIADMICVGEGEEPLRQLVERLEAGRDPTGVGSLGFRSDGPFGNRGEIRNPVQPLAQDLDAYPFPDYALRTHWVIEKGELVPARPGNLRGALRHLSVESARGCPYACAFCNNTALRQVYRGKGAWVRKRSGENVVREIEQMVASFATIERVNMVDDLFFIRSAEEIEEFAAKYTARVNLPIQLDAFPNTITERKVAALTGLPLDLVSMGIQSGSADTLNNIYARPTPLKKIIEGIDLFHRYRLRAEYHYIVTNPYEPDRNVIETMRFVATHHKGPAVLRVFPLMFYPGTPLYERARSDGLIGARDEYIYEHTYTGRTQFAKHDYLSAWLRVVLHLRNAGAPRWLCHRVIDLVTSRFMRRLLDRPAFMPAAFGTYQVVRRTYKVLIYQPFIRPFRYLRRKPRPAAIRAGGGPTLPPEDPAGMRWGPVSASSSDTEQAAGAGRRPAGRPVEIQNGSRAAADGPAAVAPGSRSDARSTRRG